jgi:hypothetical protein
VAWRKRIGIRRDLTRNQVEQGDLKRRKDEKKRWKDPGCKNGMRSQDVKEVLPLRKQDLKKLQLEGTGNVIQTYRKTTGLEIANQTAGSYVASQEIKD